MSRRRVKGRVTREGWFFVCLTTLLGLLAVNTGNNIIFSVFSLLLGLFIASGLVSTVNLSGIGTQLKLPREVYKGVQFPLIISLIRKGKLTKGLGISINLKIDGKERIRSIAFDPERNRKTVWINIEERGKHRVDGVIIQSKFPLGLVERTVLYPIDLEFLVFPKVRNVDFPPDSIDEYDLTGNPSRKREGVGGDFLGLRSYHPGDSLKNVFWKKFRLGEQMLVKQFSADTLPKSVILRVGPSPSEDEIDYIASQCVSALRKGYGVGLELPTKKIEVDHGELQRVKILTHLALIPSRGSKKENG